VAGLLPSRQLGQPVAHDFAVPPVVPHQPAFAREQCHPARDGFAGGEEQRRQHRMAGQAHQAAALQIRDQQQGTRQLPGRTTDVQNARPVGQQGLALPLVDRQFAEEVVAQQPVALQPRHVDLADPPGRNRHARQIGRPLQQRRRTHGLAAARHAHRAIDAVCRPALQQHRAHFQHLGRGRHMALPLQHLALAEPALAHMGLPGGAHRLVLPAQQAARAAGAVGAGLAVQGRQGRGGKRFKGQIGLWRPYIKGIVLSI